MRDADIRHALVIRLRSANQHRGPYRLVEEMPVGLGASRIDVGLVNGHISGYEIKSESDTLQRLPGQIVHYSRCLDYAVVVAGARHAGRVADMVPGWWGVWEASVTRAGDVRIVRLRTERINPAPDPFYVAQLLWRDETLRLLEAHGLADGLRSATRWRLWDEAAERIPLRHLRSAVRQALKQRHAPAVA